MRIRQPIVNLDGKRIETLSNFISIGMIPKICLYCQYEIALELTNPPLPPSKSVSPRYPPYKLPQDTLEGISNSGVCIGIYKDIAFKGRPDNWNLETHILTENKPGYRRAVEYADVQISVYAYWICKLTPFDEIILKIDTPAELLAKPYNSSNFAKTEEYLDKVIKFVSGESPVEYKYKQRFCEHCNNKVNGKAHWYCPHDLVDTRKKEVIENGNSRT